MYSRIIRSLHLKTHRRRLALIYAIGIFGFAILIYLISRILGSDDTVFPVQIQPYPTVFDWVNYRYHNWSGRIFAESFVYIFSPAPLYLWKIVSVFMYALCTGVLFAYSKLISRNTSNHKDYLILGLCLLVPYFMDPGVLMGSTLWVTGSMNYFWIATLGLAGFYPILYYVILHRAPRWPLTLVGLISGTIAACSQEQVGLVLVTFTGIFVIYQLYEYSRKHTERFPVYILVFLALFAAFFLISVLAPGNDVRVEQETITWLPDFHSVTLFQHINYGYRWLLEGLLNKTGFLLIGAWVLLLALFAKKPKKDKWDLLIIILLAVSLLFSLAKGHESIAYWFNFYATWKPSLPSRINYLAFVPWTTILLATITAPLILYRKTSVKKGIVLSLLFCAAIASTAVITLSPTMYASGIRTLYVPSFVLAIALLVLSIQVIDKFKKVNYIVIIAFLALAISAYVLLVTTVLQKTI